MSHLHRLRAGALAAPESGIVAVINHARGREGLIPLWAGEGDLSTPGFIADAAAASLRAGETFYTWQRGIPELRQAIADYTARLYARPTAFERIFVTGSGMHAIQTAMTAIAGAGDEVVYVGPLWPNCAAAIGLAGARGVEVLLDRGPDGWSLDIARVEAAVGPQTRAIFLNSPNNPTGWTADRETLQAVLDLARRHGFFVIADEIYARFYYAGARAPSFHDVAGPEDPVIYVNSFSKNWAMTGWRVGWIEAPEAFGDLIENLIQYSTSGVAAFMQRGAIAALRDGESFVVEQIARAHKARDIFTSKLLATNRVELTPPAGAFYAFFAIDGVEDSRSAVLKIADEANVGLAPGTAFGSSAPRFMRACYHRRLDEVEEAADRLAAWIARR